MDKVGKKVLLKNCMEYLNIPFGGNMGGPIWWKNVIGRLVGTINFTNWVKNLVK